MLEGKKIILGVTGGIAAYKAAMLVRLLVKRGAEVKVIMTAAAKQFITPLTMATLSKNPILVEFFDPENGSWNSHVSLGEWADALVIAPATANTLAKMAAGIADNLLLTTYLSARCGVIAAPAMDLDMYAHPATQTALSTLRGRGVEMVEPGDGELASGLSGKGRMAEPEEIVAALERHFQKKKSLTGRKFLVTAGPTVERIDPVRYISNHSTGKMGYAIAAELSARGAEVVLVSGPVSLSAPAGVRRISVTSAAEMYEASKKEFAACDGAVLCAAVADFTPADPAQSKIKKQPGQTGGLTLELKPTVDIARELSATKGNKLTVGFALETDNEEANALDKLRRKSLDMIVLNSLRDEGAGFGHDTNRILIFDALGQRTDSGLLSKRECASLIADRIETLL